MSATRDGRREQASFAGGAPTYLDSIVAWHRARAAADGRDPLALRSAASGCKEPVRRFAESLRAERPTVGNRRSPAIIAEIKRRSPSKGEISPGLDPAGVATDYERGGASALSVLTDAPHFGGSADDLREARLATGLPVLRKDFTVSPNDVCDARLMGADAVLLIVAALSDEELGSFIQLAESLGLDALVEAHDEHEADRAVAAGSSLIGINQRDLHSFEVDTERAVRVAGHLPGSVLKVAESGIRNAADVAVLAAAGYDAVLVGETLVRSPDRAAAVAELRGSDLPCG